MPDPHPLATGNGGFDYLAINATARYVRMNGLARATTFDYSVWELGVYR